jgi:uncharacterized protein YebE (UPF0316 family)
MSTRRKSVSGFVVKKEVYEIDPKTHVRTKHRSVVSRVYHSRDAAETLMKLLKERNPETDYYIHEANRSDDVTLF